jgi:hypothetical protein
MVEPREEVLQMQRRKARRKKTDRIENVLNKTQLCWHAKARNIGKKRKHANQT